MSAIAAVDVALWDIKGKALNTPVYNLLGGKSRQGCLVYTHANGADIAEALDSVRKHMDEATSPSAPRPASPASPPATESQKPASPTSRRARLPSEILWSSERYLNFAPKLFERLRVELGTTSIFSTTSTTASPPSKPRASANLRALPSLLDGRPLPRRATGKLRAHPPPHHDPIATGEVFNSIWDAHDLIRHQLIDYIRMTIVHGGGITHAKKTADFAALYQRPHRLPRRH